jgi:hypothetical protein
LNLYKRLAIEMLNSGLILTGESRLLLATERLAFGNYFVSPPGFLP